MNASLRHLQAFILVYRLRSLTRAAQEMRVTQSAVSILIRQMEEMFGLRLFDRTTRVLNPTPAAVAAFPLAERIVGDASGLAQQMRDLAEAKSGRVVFAVSAGAASALLPDIIGAFRERHPAIEIVMYDVAADQLTTSVAAADVEFGIGSVEEGGPDLTVEPLMRGRLSAIGRKDGSFENRRQISWDRLAGMTIIAMRRDTRIRAQIDHALTRQHKRLSPTYEVSLINTALAMSAHGIGISILPAHMLPPLQFPSLVAVPLVEPTIDRPLSLIRRSGRSLSPAAENFIKTARQQIRLRGAHKSSS
ncbi:LysR family transcriptional regulator [Bradyrhizobium prioriisuperbiae]|uniref:LysR family transcriptional regulator n=1 Tax=Bradyrhizobium prioriisuperbiae TaxID=2854389 RepID=UPI0028EEB141|nr:LysR family transcriptional regulator [Bradyrhizobium prioritasuperba]